MKIMKWIGIVVLVLIVFVVIAGAVGYFTANSRLTKAPDVPVANVSIPDDAASIQRGEHIALGLTACIGCHGEQLEGEVFIDETPIGYVPAPNLTNGAGGIGGELTDEQWIAAIRHGIGHDGRVIGFMPSNAYAHIGDEDLGALVAYLKQLPPVNNELGERKLQVLGTLVFGFMEFSSTPVQMIDHATVGGSAPPAGVTAEYGEYLSQIGVCRDCHATNLAGKTDPNGPPMGPNITPGGRLTNYNEAQFLAFMRSGMTSDGRQIDGEEMPWLEYRHQTDEELQALYAYLSSSEALPDNE